MPYPQDLAGKFINYKINAVRESSIPAAQKQYGATQGMWERALLPVYREQAGAPAPLVPMGPGPGYVNTNVPWTFRFLWYLPGKVTEAPLVDPVLTGPMTGCYLFTYSKGGMQVCHVGTENTPTSQNTKNAKAEWSLFLMGAGATQVKGASPAALFTMPELAGACAGIVPAGPPVVCGYFAADGTAYAMAMVPIAQPIGGAGGSSTLIKILTVKPMPLSPWATIQNFPEFS